MSAAMQSISMARSAEDAWDTEYFRFAAASRPELSDRLAAFASRAGQTPDSGWRLMAADHHQIPSSGPFRLAIVARDARELSLRLAAARDRITDPNRTRLRDAAGVYFESEPLADQGTLAFLFPGEVSQFLGMVDDLVHLFPPVAEFIAGCDAELADRVPELRGFSHSFRHRPENPEARREAEANLRRIDRAMLSTLMGDGAVFHALESLGFEPSWMAGHSMGEQAALAAADAAHGDESFVACFAEALADFRQTDRLGENEFTLLAVAAGKDQVQSLLDDQQAIDLFLAMDNCPHQVILVGRTAPANRLREILSQHRLLTERLPLTQPYHTPLFASALPPIRNTYAALKFQAPRIPVYSAITARPYPSDIEEIRSLSLRNWVEPVRFREVILDLFARGARVFVEAGPRNTLSAFVEDTLRGERYCAVPIHVPQRSGALQLHHALAQLWVQGFAVSDPLHAKIRGWDKLDVDLLRADAKVALALPTSETTHHVHEPKRPLAAAGRTAAVLAHQSLMTKFLATQEATVLQYLSRRRRAPNRRRSPDPGMTAAFAIAAQPLLGAPVDYQPGKTAVFERLLDLREDRFAIDHTVGGHQVSKVDPFHRGVPVLPLTFFLELAAEAAQVLCPQRQVTAIRDITLTRWLPYDSHDPSRIRVAATRIESGNTPGVDRCLVEVFEVDELDDANSRAGRLTVELRREFPQGAPSPLSPLRPVPAPDLSQAELYRCLFHGRRFQGMRRIAAWGDRGVDMLLEVLPRTDLLASQPDPPWTVDPVMLDVAMHPMATWHDEQPDRNGRILLPVSAEAFEFFRSRPSVGEELHAHARLRTEHPRYFVHDGDIFTASGDLWVRMVGVRCWRFYVPFSECNFHGPKDRYFLSRRWPAIADAVWPSHLVMDLDPPADMLQPPLNRVLAQVTLTREEFLEFRGTINGKANNIHELLERLMAKDACRALWADMTGERLFPADIAAPLVAPATYRPGHRGRPDEQLPEVHVARVGKRLLGLATVGPVLAMSAAELSADSDSIQRAREEMANQVMATCGLAPSKRCGWTTLPAGAATCRIKDQENGFELFSRYHDGSIVSWIQRSPRDG